MEKKQLLLDPADYKKLRKWINDHAANSGDMKIGNKHIKHFMVAAASHDDKADPVDIRTKRIILDVAGLFSTDPATLKPAIELEKNLHYNDDDFAILRVRLNKLLKELKPGASISKSEMSDCVTVGDCVDLVSKKIK